MDEETFQKMVERQYETMRRDRIRQLEDANQQQSKLNMKNDENEIASAAPPQPPPPTNTTNSTAAVPNDVQPSATEQEVGFVFYCWNCPRYLFCIKE